jgi:enterochelin esterase family protein
MGSSLGAVASLATAWHNPTVFGRVGLLSGSFVNTTDSDWPGPVSEEIVGFLVELESDLKLEQPKIYQSVGRYEGLIDFNRRLAPILRAGGADLRYRETWDGHDWGSWRTRLPEALSFMFPGPAASPTKN